MRRIVVVLSHWHLDHVAGTAAFADCEIVASRLTGERLARQRSAIEGGTLEGPPAISPLILPSTVFDGRTELAVGKLRADLVQFDIHSADGTALHIPGEGLLLAGDMLEDTATYVSEPGGSRRTSAARPTSPPAGSAHLPRSRQRPCDRGERLR